MPKYLPSDDGKVIDGKTIVFINLPGAAGPAGSADAGAKAADGTSSTSTVAAGKRPTPAEKEAVAGAQAAALTSAAKDGVPFCEECEQARRELAAK